MRLGIDTGGTFTDAVLYGDTGGEDGVIAATAKTLTTKHDLAIGVSGAIEAVLEKADADDPIRLVSLSTTLATNALVEGQGSPVCLLLAGFADAALDRARLREALAGDPAVLVGGGHNALGAEQAPLDTAAVEAAIAGHAPKVAAFAVAGYFGARNPDHEIRIRDLVREATGLPVTCAHELSSNLDAPRRALTTVLNARLIPFLQALILSVERTLDRLGIAAPLMVVKGDGSLMTSETALTRPVETVLSGPAASVVGARVLAAARTGGELADMVISDMGGTTTDVALLRGGRPVLNPDGAVVGGWRTMVEAVAVHTAGLGGDSEVRFHPSFSETGGIAVGPRRAVPLSLLAHQYPEVLDTLRRQAARAEPVGEAGRFALRLRPLDTGETSLNRYEREAWEKLAAGPVALEDLYAAHNYARPVGRLIERGLAIHAAFTPSDAAHVLGRHDAWSGEAARLGAELGARRLGGIMNAEAIAAGVFDRVVRLSAETIAGAVLAEETGADLVTPGPAARILLDKALGIGDLCNHPGGSLIDVKLALTVPLVGIGAPAETYYPDVAKRLGANLIVPAHAGVCNAVGAVAGGVSQTVVLTVTSPDDMTFRVHHEGGVTDFSAADAAIAFAEDHARTDAAARARAAGADTTEVTMSRDDKTADLGGGATVFLESRVTATAHGRPRIA